MPAVLMGGSIGGEVSFLNERELVRGPRMTQLKRAIAGEARERARGKRARKVDRGGKGGRGGGELLSCAPHLSAPVLPVLLILIERALRRSRHVQAVVRAAARRWLDGGGIARTCQVKSSQVESSQVESSQVKSSQVKRG